MSILIELLVYLPSEIVPISQLNIYFMGNFIFKVLVVKQNENIKDEFFGVHREVFECYFSSSDEVCDLIQRLSDWFLSFQVQKINISDPSVFTQILEKFELKD